MKKVVIVFFGLFLAYLNVYASDNTIYSEDFERYSCNAVYNSENMTVSYNGKTADISSSQSLIINGPGGIYAENEAYTANAAENIYCYAKTGEGEGKLVFGGLGNGWHGRYSHPPNTLDGKGGATSELNLHNRRLAVIPFQGNKVLSMNPAKNDYASTYCIYANDDENFYEHTKWSTDVYISGMGDKGYYSIYLSKGALNAPRPFEYLSGVNDGRDEIFDILKFSPGNEISFLGETTSEYEFKKWYHIEINIDKDASNAACSVRIENKQTGDVIFESGKTALDFTFDNDKCGIGYNAYTHSKGAATEVYIDNITVEPIEFYAVLAGTRDVSINAKGNTAIKFNSEYVEDSISVDTVKVFLGEVEVEGISVSLLSQNRVKIGLPKLEPAKEYIIVVKNVLGKNGIYADCRIPFKTVSLVTASNAGISDKNLSVKLNNNSTDDITVTVLVTGENDNEMIETAVYKRINIAKDTAVTEVISGIMTDKVKNVHVYVLDGLTGYVNPISDDIVLRAE